MWCFGEVVLGECIMGLDHSLLASQIDGFTEETQGWLLALPAGWLDLSVLGYWEPCIILFGDFCMWRFTFVFERRRERRRDKGCPLPTSLPKYAMARAGLSKARKLVLPLVSQWVLGTQGHAIKRDLYCQCSSWDWSWFPYEIPALQVHSTSHQDILKKVTMFKVLKNSGANKFA